MDKIMAMREKRAEMWEQAKQFLDSHEKDGHLTAEDAKAYEQMENEVLALGKDIERMERGIPLCDAQSTPYELPTGGERPAGRRGCKRRLSRSRGIRSASDRRSE